MLKVILALLTLFVSFSHATPTYILFNDTNNVVIRGSITESVADDFLYQILLRKPEYVYINSPGGSVAAGNRMVSAILNSNLTCIADKAYSMAFVILQACQNRYITSTATVMQHQMSLGLRGNLANINSYLEMVNSAESFLLDMQAKRIGLSAEKFARLTESDWWLFGETIIEHNVADKVVTLECTPDLVAQNVSVSRKAGFFGEEKIEIFSRCPLIHQAISSAYKDDFFFEIKDREDGNAVDAPEIYLQDQQS
jgi:ATP-dependent protease ClpP protease subunit